jgi:glutathione synthase/RimK-type ligase-like ATP-grasp enzyme
MSGWLLLVDEPEDAEGLDASLPVAATRRFLSDPPRAGRTPAKIINLSRAHGYQTAGYYASLLAEARGHRVVPSVETVLDLSSREGYGRALPELDHALDRDLARAGAVAPARILVCFGQAAIPGLGRFSRLLFDWFRAPIIEVFTEVRPSGRVVARRLKPKSIHRLGKAERAFLAGALAVYTRRSWRPPKLQRPLRHAIAVLQDPREALPPSSTATLRRWAAHAARQGVEVEPITRRDLASLVEFDALFIRETTSILNHTFRFARRAEAEGMPVIDDTKSMIRCTNKVYLWELLRRAALPTPDTMLVGPATPPEAIADALGLPVVLKVPDGSFSRGVKKAATLAELTELMARFLRDSDLILAQRFLPTTFDWRIGVLGGRALFACQYLMARGHWQIVEHRDGRPARQGGFRTVPLAQAPANVVDLAVASARLIGDGLYGVDIKETPSGVVVIEINDNPNIEHGVEDAAEKDAVWDSLTRWFVDRLTMR